MLRNGIKCIYFGDQTVSDYHGEAFEITGAWLFVSNAGDRIRTNSMNLSFIKL